MTDKQYFCTVANDGVAVCVCKYRPCEKLKRKEQECEKLKSELSETIGAIDNVRKSKEHYQQECKELETQLKQVKYLYEVQDEKLIDELATENKKYKQALDEIEKIASRYMGK